MNQKVEFKARTAVLTCVLFCVIYSRQLTNLLSPLLLSSHPWHPLCQSNLRRVAFCFAITSFGFGVRAKPKGCMQHVKQGFSFLSPRRALEGCEDHQRCQLQIQINYNLEDDPSSSSDIDCMFPLFMLVCIYFQALFHISSHALKRARLPKAQRRSWESEVAHWM